MRFSVSVTPDLLKDFDEVVSEIGYTRSSAIQVAMRDFITDHKWTLDPKAKIVGAITMIYDHDIRGLGDTLTDLQHTFLEAITSTTHVHLNERDCLEIIVFKGVVKEIQGLAEKLMTLRGIEQVKLAILMIK